MVRIVEPRRLRVLLGLFVPLAAGCGGDSTKPLTAVSLAVVTQPPVAAQSGVALTEAPVVELRDRNGAPFASAGVAVTVGVIGGGTLSGTATQSTDPQGRATFAGLVIAGIAGQRTLNFTSSGLQSATSQSMALGAGPAATIQSGSSTTLQATVNTAVATAPAVIVKDGAGNPVPGISVTFAIGSNAGSLTGATQTTSASGVATIGGWTLPTSAGQYTLTVTANGVSGSGVTFTATATPDVPSAMQPSNSGQRLLYGIQLPNPLQVHVVDQFGNATPGAVVTWTTLAGDGTVTAVDAATDANGIARANYRLGLVPGLNRIEASIASRGLTSDFTASALAVKDFTVGYEHRCALDEDANAYCWGKNDFGQLGFNSTSFRAFPTPVAGGLHFRRITAGNNVTCALTTDNTPYCWGSNSFAALGDGTTSYRLVPTPVSGGFHFTEISTGGQDTCALDVAGAAYCWGQNLSSVLGTGSTPPDTCHDDLNNVDFGCSKAPVAVSGGHAFTAISTANGASCGLQASGEVYCWGFSANFGGPSSTGIDAVPALVSNGLAFSEISESDFNTCGLVAPSSVYCWGNETQWGAVGNGITNATEVKPVPLPGLTAMHVEARGIGDCALSTDGHAFCWGYNDTGGIGDGTTTTRTTPTAVSTSVLFTAIHTAGKSACGLTANGQLYCWGDGSTSTPTLVNGS